ncbi:hypothetical protein WR25_21622 [Diploscapter pachys]|uniref:SH2 domain-containing protein n=1 Tax=Diploscapter pachys TaxID=2018661 RepID=A0A2A2LXH3_9BILA|nr:hypothetical protein WR25_21622 [Diploscapter pachys]
MNQQELPTKPTDYGAMMIRVTAGVVIGISIMLILLVVGNMIYGTLTQNHLRDPVRRRVAAQPEDVFLPERSVTARPLNSVPYPYPMESVLKELSSTEYAMDQPTSSKALTRTITVRRKEPVLKERNGKAIKTKLRSLCPCLANSEINLESSDEENQSQAESQRRLANDLESSQVANAESVEMLSCAAKNIRQQMASLALSNGERSRASSENELTVHRLVEYAYHLVPDLNKIYAAPYYHGVMDRYEAEKLLDEKPEGTFLLRDSAQTGYLFSVSFRRYQRTLHARIEQANHRFGFDILDESIFSAPTVSQLIDNYKDPQKCLFFEPCLNLPLRRTNVFSLQELSRAAIASHTTYAKVSKLRLPNKLKEYVRSYYYMTPVRSINIIN